MKTLRIVGPFHNIGGYSHAARGLLAAALVAGFTVEAVESETNDVVDLPINGAPARRTVPKFPNKPIPDIQRAELEQALWTTVNHDAPTILMGNPGMMQEYPEYCQGPRIGYTMLESDTLNPLWATACRNVDLMLAPSRWCVDTIRRAVPDVPVELLPICVDERLWSPEGPKWKAPADAPPFLFLSVFSTCERKGWRKTIQAFAEEFRGEDVGLVLKPTRAAEVEELAEWVRSMGTWVHIVKGEMTDEDMAGLYRACDVYVSAASEGFGVPVVESALCGLPSIALAAGGTADLVSDANGYPVPVEWAQCVGQLPQIYPSGHQWPTCSVTDLRMMMREAFFWRGHGLRGLNSRNDAVEKFSRAAVASRLNELALEDLWPMPLPEARRRKKLPPFIAVVTTHNNRESTNRTVQSLLCSEAPPRMIVIADDSSTDDTHEWADAMGLFFVKCDTGGNVSQNRQKAVDALKRQFTFSDDPYVVFFDNDVEILPGFWPKLSEVMHTHPQIGILAPLKRYGDGEHDGEVQNVGNRLYFNGGSGPLRLDRPLVHCDYVESACMVVRPEVWRSIEWDPQFPIFYEDADYCFQARAAGWEVCATASAQVIHHAHTTSHARAAESDLNRRKFIQKWKERL